jgi:hypothetical protein
VKREQCCLRHTGNDSIFDDELYKEYVNRTISDFNEVGALVKKGPCVNELLP